MKSVKKCKYLAFGLLAALFVMWSCENGGVMPPEAQPEGGGKISGKVIDCVTGDPLEGFHVQFGSYDATTDIDGAYEISIPESVMTVSGDYACYKDYSYDFSFFEGISVDPTKNPVYNVKRCRHDETYFGFPSITLSGKILDENGTEIPNGSFVGFIIFNDKGGCSKIESMYNDMYEIETKTFGQNCIIVVRIADAEENPVATFYLTNQDLTTDKTDYDLQPLTTGYTTVEVNGVENTAFMGNLVIPNYGYVGEYAFGFLDGVTSTDVEIYNPESYSMIWWTMEEVSGPNPGETTRRCNISAESTFLPIVTLPGKPSSSVPSGAVYPPASYDDASRTISFSGVSGANFYVCDLLEKDTGGMLFLNSTDYSLPTDFFASVIEPGAGWDFKAEATRFVPTAGSIDLFEGVLKDDEAYALYSMELILVELDDEGARYTYDLIP